MSENLHLTVDRSNDLAVVKADGYINRSGGEAIVRVASGLMDQGYKRLLLNLSGTKILNLPGLSVVAELNEKLNRIGGRLAFCGLTPTIEKVFRIRRLGESSEIFADEESALASLH